MTASAACKFVSKKQTQDLSSDFIFHSTLVTNVPFTEVKMSQVVLSRPGSQASRVGVLPRIEHPLSRLENPDKISVRGTSRASYRSGEAPGANPRKSSRPNAMSPQRKDLSPKMPMAVIPEGVQVVQSTDPDKTTLPIFGKFIEWSRPTPSKLCFAFSCIFILLLREND